ncbi:lytic transglycosylase domain-containing protein, partial [Rhizobium ruizarguesonis]
MKTLVLAAAAALAAFTSEASASTGACEREIQSAAAKYGIPEGILYSVGLT